MKEFENLRCSHVLWLFIYFSAVPNTLNLNYEREMELVNNIWIYFH